MWWTAVLPFSVGGAGAKERRSHRPIATVLLGGAVDHPPGGSLDRTAGVGHGFCSYPFNGPLPYFALMP
jgi:hypothetical protein